MVLPNFKENLAKYAKLLVSTGINVQPGHTVQLTIGVEQAELARLIVKEAYAHGAKEVLVNWLDDVIARERLVNVDVELLEQVHPQRITEMNYLLERKASRLVVLSEDPGAYDGVDPEKLSRNARALSQALNPMRQASQANKISWTLGAASGLEWAKKVFPNATSDEEAVDLLWDQIFKTCRIYDEDPIKAWEEHEARLVAKAKVLNDEQFVKLHYTAPGTDLVLGMPKNHLWEAAGSINAQGEKFIANMPTEEVFTAPDYRVADGYVTSTKPLSYNGNIIEGIKVTFKDGEIVDVTAEKGDEVMKKLVFDNAGARGLGEVALVPDKSPISQSGVTFFNTLFDENASNHLAIGQAYAFSIEGGTEMSQEELKEAGLNRSDVHVDFMIGSNKMNIDGIREDGTRVPIFRDGEWAI
ncbi:TPA: aminopeptidase [Streptococcus suis]|uniref:Aminopeptidase PepS n=5 Tax=Streptococcus suis TaxID=1307 RepID=A0A0H3N6G4_STRS4|nr:aminopeptidase [Streptococcus suis]ABP90917.1 Leucyl aminopeptidase (aminopeptidase T) [Streptococcus suis 05ZYH33]ABP93114.1 Leucyl aminopeptidase (aminopeptidase T) [Streptococcus suis 98HAH33]ADE32221.1 aminopeptidase PepS [Streptococcus suis GZ1]ADV70960.1 leucyl aminopeptidase (aminopeptidase T) [Streptococcus suis JS14]AER16062.1 leucyl aminopeptidase (aminopeptidase T) [Streptococcus suis SS12]